MALGREPIARERAREDLVSSHPLGDEEKGKEARGDRGLGLRGFPEGESPHRAQRQLGWGRP